MKLAFIYAGQGSQRARMGLDLYENYPEFSKVIDRAAAELDFDLKQAMFSADEEQLNRTEITQPALAAFAAGVTAVLKRHGILPEVALGLSLGEYSALHAAGVFDADELISLTAFRGRAMAKAGEGVSTLMCAVLGLSFEVTEAVCEKASKEAGAGEWVRVVNYNTVGQEVISGTKEAVKLAEEIAKEAGAKRCMELKVSSAFHTPLMEPAAKELKKRFKKQNLHPMQIPVIFNTTAKELQKNESIAELLVKQVKSPVKMSQSISYLKEMGVTHVIEIGAGHVLSGFIKRITKDMQVFSIEDVATMEEVLQAFREEKA